MRVLFTASRWPGHFFPMVPLGWALQAAGHEVLVACAPGLAATVTGAGMTAAAICDDQDLVPMNRAAACFGWGHPAGGGGIPLLDPATGAELPAGTRLDYEQFRREWLSPSLDRLVDSLAPVLAFARRWQPDLVVSDLAACEGRTVATALGVPLVWHLWGAVGPCETKPGLQFFRPLMPRVVDRYGLDPTPPETVVLDPCPPQLAPPVQTERLAMRIVPYNGPARLPDWLDRAPDRPRVCVTWGSSVTRIFGTRSFLVPLVLRALAGLDVEVVVAVNETDRELLGALPDNVAVAGRIPLSAVLPSCAAVVHHGGAGSMLTALDAGVPQVSLTFGGEQELEADRLAGTGAGSHLPGRTATGSAVAAAVTSLLTEPAVRRSADRLRTANRARPAPTQVVDDLVRLAGRKGAA